MACSPSAFTVKPSREKVCLPYLPHEIGTRQRLRLAAGALPWPADATVMRLRHLHEGGHPVLQGALLHSQLRAPPHLQLQLAQRLSATKTPAVRLPAATTSGVPGAIRPGTRGAGSHRRVKPSEPSLPHPRLTHLRLASAPLTSPLLTAAARRDLNPRQRIVHHLRLQAGNLLRVPRHPLPCPLLHLLRQPLQGTGPLHLARAPSHRHGDPPGTFHHFMRQLRK